MSCEGIVENLVADIIFIILIAIIGWLWISLTRRRSLQKFFGVSKSKRLIVYLSNLRVQTFGAIGISGRKMSYQGSTVAYGEMKAALVIRRLFSFLIPALEDLPEFMRRLLISDVHVDLSISPISRGELEARSSYLSLGSSAYNVASKDIEDRYGKSKFRFGVLEKSELTQKPFAIRPTAFSTDAEPVVMGGGTTVSLQGVPNGVESSIDEVEKKQSAVIIESMPPFEDSRNAFVQRIVDRASNRSLFYIAGLSEHSTQGAANYLVYDWYRLYKKFKDDKSFIVVLLVDEVTPESWTVLFEKTIVD